MEISNKAETLSTCMASGQTVSNSAQVTQLQLAAMTSNQWLDLSLVTKEGDKVTLSADAKASALFIAFGETQVGAGEDLHTQWDELSYGQYESDMALTVAGDLNAEERREIYNVLKTINKMMGDFVRNQIGAMGAAVGGLQGLHTIEGLQVNMAFERQAVMVQQSQAAISYDRNGEAHQISAVPDEGIELPLAAASESLAARMARMVAVSDAPADPLRQMAEELLKANRIQAGRHNPLAGRILRHVHNLFRKALDTNQPVTGNHKPRTS